MSAETAYVVGVPAGPDLAALLRDIVSARGRAAKADPGDRLDIVRFEALMTELERRAAAADPAGRVWLPPEVPHDGVTLIGADEARWPDALPAPIRDAARIVAAAGEVPVLIVDPFVPAPALGESAGMADDRATAQTAPAQRWDSGGQRGLEAVESRFRAQLVEALTGQAARPIAPSGLQNSVVTELLREFVAAVPGTARREVPVEYRDGSRSAHRFQLRALTLRPLAPGDDPGPVDRELRFALLSIRHAEMDALVHGAWLRNAEISRPRPAAQTDDLVYEISRRQLAELTRGGERILLHLYQTGLETACVGFYKALVDHLLRAPASVSVQPMYFESRRRPTGQKNRAGEVTTDSTIFRKGTPWAI